MKLAWILVLLCGMKALAGTYYVSPSGNNSNPGSLALPWATIQQAANVLKPGDVVYVRGGIYRRPVTVNVSGSAGQRIVFSNYPGERPIIDATGVAVAAGDTGLFMIRGKSYISVRGFELRNYKTSNPNLVPAGIWVSGAAHHIELRNNEISAIVNSHVDGNAFGIAIYGTSAAQSITGVVIDGNSVHHLRTGNSESVVLNGNVSNFQVTANRVFENNNIGIDFIGFEGTCPDATLDQARDGLCRGNTVYNNSSRANPSYFGDSSAGGIYCDGATRILIERNSVSGNDIGIELASEHANRKTSAITVRNNLIRNNRVVGISVGGYDARRGATQQCLITNNTLYHNDSLRTGTGELNFQFYVANCRVAQNIVFANDQGLVFGNLPSGNTGNVFDYNLYYSPLGALRSEWQWSSRTYSGFSAWRAATSQDTHSIFAVPGFVDELAGNFRLSAGSPALNAGDPAFVPAAGELDFFHENRLSQGRVDIGADERGL